MFFAWHARPKIRRLYESTMTRRVISSQSASTAAGSISLYQPGSSSHSSNSVGAIVLFGR
jgi:hypothetical protein